MESTADKKWMTCVRHKAERATTQDEKSHIFIKIGDNDKDRLEKKIIQLDWSALLGEEKRLSIPRI